MCGIVWVSPQEHVSESASFHFFLQRPLLSRESKTRLSDSVVVHEVCIDRRGRLPGFSPLTVDSNSRHKGFLDGRHSCGGLEVSWCSGQLS